MIKDFLDYKNEVSLITRPRRFGKTLNMTMLREFFDIEKESHDIFEGLKIMETQYAKELNSRPVVYLTLKNCSGNNMNQMCISLALTIFDEYLKYNDIFKGNIESEDYLSFYKIYAMLRKVGDEEEKDAKPFSDDDNKLVLLKRSLTELIKAVSVFYKQKVLVLIDEYDQPLIKAHEMGYRVEFSKGVYGSFLGSALKGNDYLEQALLTGIQRVAKESIFSEVNNFKVYTVMNERYASYFGLTEGETTKILEDYGFLMTNEIKSYYDGYTFGSVEIYNPWSILSYVDEKELKPYWLNTSTNGLIRELVPNGDEDFSEEFEVLIKDGQVEVYMSLEASFFELEEPETLWGLLVNSGYLTVIEDLGEGEYLLRIPNQEVKQEFRTLVSKYANIKESAVHRMFSALSKSDMEKFIKNYQKLIVSVVSFHDAPSSEENKLSENSFHMLFLGMAISASGMYKIKSNRETGDGRSDIVMKSLELGARPHVLIEFKHDEDLQKGANDALSQIFEQRYYAELVGKVLCIGIAHFKKKCELIYQEIMVDEFGSFFLRT